MLLIDRDLPVGFVPCWFLAALPGSVAPRAVSLCLQYGGGR
ncbi:hypothetical protein NP284_05795 [Rhodopseudomonas pseudopalustris]